jgi:hypothetical protein
MHDAKRRQVLALIVPLSLYPIIRPIPAYASGKAATVVWGGLGYGVAGGEATVNKKFPNLTSALDSWSDFRKTLVAGLTDAYPGGLDNPGLINTNDDPALLVVVSLEFEQVFFVPDDGGSGKDYQVTHVYASSQVLYYDPPREGGSEGSIAVLYSFPFRASRVSPVSPGDQAAATGNVRELLIKDERTEADSLAGYFQEIVAARKFRQKRVARKFAVGEVRFSEAMVKRVGEFGLAETLTPELFGQALTASIGGESGASVVPYGQTDTLSKRLAARFDKYQVFGDLIQKMKDEGAAYRVDVEVAGILRKPNGSTSEKINFMRGVLVQLKIFRTPFDRAPQLLLDEKIRLIQSTTLAKLMMDKLVEYDKRFFTQIVIALFDRFVSSVMKDDQAALKELGLDTGKSVDSIAKVKEALLKCQYDAV